MRIRQDIVSTANLGIAIDIRRPLYFKHTSDARLRVPTHHVKLTHDTISSLNGRIHSHLATWNPLEEPAYRLLPKTADLPTSACLKSPAKKVPLPIPMPHQGGGGVQGISEPEEGRDPKIGVRVTYSRIRQKIHVALTRGFPNPRPFM
ncbi:hypothetical protein GCM10009826_00770 [Humibacillus xanthopallidus]